MSNLLEQPPYLTSLDNVLKYALIHMILILQHLRPIFLQF